MESTLLVLILLVLIEALLSGGVRGLVLHALAALVLCAAVVAVVGAIAYVASQTSHPWGTAYLIVFGAVWTWLAAEWLWKQVAAWKRGGSDVERDP